jgi:hypothetical protein
MDITSLMVKINNTSVDFMKFNQTKVMVKHKEL